MSIKIWFCGHYNFTMSTFYHFMDAIFFKNRTLINIMRENWVEVNRNGVQYILLN